MSEFRLLSKGFCENATRMETPMLPLLCVLLLAEFFLKVCPFCIEIEFFRATFIL